MNYSDLSKFLWGYALETMVYILNSVPIKSIPISLVELWAQAQFTTLNNMGVPGVCT